MLAQRVSEWTSQWKKQGWIEGMEKGIEKGVIKGMEKGIKKGIEEGHKKGLEQALDIEKALLVQQIEHRFGTAVSKTAKDIIQPISQPETLHQIGCLIIDCQDETNFLLQLNSLM